MFCPSVSSVNHPTVPSSYPEGVSRDDQHILYTFLRVSTLHFPSGKYNISVSVSVHWDTDRIIQFVSIETIFL